MPVSQERYLRAHKQPPSGVNTWSFTPKKFGVPDSDEVFTVEKPMRLGVAAVKADKWAREHGYDKVYVLESIHLTESGLKSALDRLDEIHYTDDEIHRLNTVVKNFINRLSVMRDQ